VPMPVPVPLVDLGGRRLVLASGSPRRRELLALLGLEFDVVLPDLDETSLPGEEVEALVVRLAAAKARAVSASRPDAIVLGADTAVDVDGLTLGKPADPVDARRMLELLSGRDHAVFTAVAVTADGHLSTAVTRSTVSFAPLDHAQIEWYVDTGEPFDKAGAYALQGVGGAFVSTVCGSVSGVLGLPLHETGGLLRPWGRIGSSADQRTD
jgi:septum formation protein